MKLIAQSFFFLLAIGFYGTAHAGANTGTLNALYLNAFGGVSVTLNGNYNAGTPPSCAATGGGITIFFLDATTPVGQLYFRSLHAAKIAGQTVTIIGTGNCNGPQENIAAINFL